MSQMIDVARKRGMGSISYSRLISTLSPRTTVGVKDLEVSCSGMDSLFKVFRVIVNENNS